MNFTIFSNIIKLVIDSKCGCFQHVLTTISGIIKEYIGRWGETKIKKLIFCFQNYQKVRKCEKYSKSFFLWQLHKKIHFHEIWKWSRNSFRITRDPRLNYNTQHGTNIVEIPSFDEFIVFSSFGAKKWIFKKVVYFKLSVFS